jgi:ABC-type phosphate/phosphonate transport system substrate-binding protein
MSAEPLVVGAVAYTPNVVPIWEGIRSYFQASENQDGQMDFVLYSNYARLVDSLIAGHIDIAWNTNLAYVRTVLQTDGHCTALAQRDSDVDFTTVFVARHGSPLAGAEDIAGKRLALGSADSAHAAILPLYYLRRAGVDEADLQITRFDTDIGKHGDTGRSELDALEAVLAGEADVAAIGSSTWAAMGAEELMRDSLAEVWRTDGYCHCMFTALDTLPAGRYNPWLDRLLAMSWDNPEHRKILEMEGLRRWVRPHLDGYQPLFEAVKEQGVDPRW